jgi:hypothetical protein
MAVSSTSNKTHKRKNHKKPKFDTDLCDDKMTFHECELSILRHAVDKIEKQEMEKKVSSDDVVKMIAILEKFLRRKKCICYGGTAINNILPEQAQFYDKALEIPDYDFYSPNALADAKELADNYKAAGFSDIEAKSGVHHGTFKVFVNYTPIADITYLHPAIYKSILRDAIRIDGINYAPPDFLRMGMYLELSRPAGDVSRWEKVLKRLTLLNAHYPLKQSGECSVDDFGKKETKLSKMYFEVRDTFIDQGVVFIGGYASRLYSRYAPGSQKTTLKSIPDFDVLSETPDKCADAIVGRLETAKFANIRKVPHPPIGEIVPEAIEIRVGNESIAFIYKPIACHNYNVIESNGRKTKVATIDTMMSFYLAFYYTDKSPDYKRRILCLSTYLFDIEQKNRLVQKGVLKRFSVSCYGKQPTLETMRAERMAKFEELKDKRGTPEFEMWFLNYNPHSKRNKTAKHKGIPQEPDTNEFLVNF